jgi:hypothetical protein
MAQSPLAAVPGLFATGTGCGAAGVPPFQIGGGAATYSYDGNVLPNPTPLTASITGGNIGANGAIGVQGTSTTVNGSISSTLPPGVNAGCPAGATSVAGNGKIWDPNANPPQYVSLSSLTPQQIQNDGLMPQLGAPYNPPVPTIPAKVPTTLCTAGNGCLSPIQTCTQTCNKVKGKLVCTMTCINSGYTLAPGSYGDIQLTGGTQLTLTGGTYNINSITVTGNSNVTIAGSTTINLAGQADANLSNSTVADFTGGSITNSSGNPANFTIKYGGTDTIILNGGGGLFAVIDAPQANLSLKGGGNFYGQAVAATIDDRGGTNFFFDTTLNNDVNDSPFVEITMRELSY